MKVSKVALAAATLVGGSTVALPAQAQQPQPAPQTQNQPAQTQNQPAQAQQPERRYALSREEQAAINPLLQANSAAAASGDWASVQALLPAAEAAARSNDARYLVARVQLAVGIGTNNIDAQERAITALLGNPATPQPEAATLRTARDGILNQRAEHAFNRGDFAAAEAIYAQLLQANPNDARLQQNLSVVRARSGNAAGALEPILQQIRTAEAAGQRPPEDLYRRAFDLQTRAGQTQQAATTLSALIRAYPTAANWRLAVDLGRRAAGNDNQLVLDIYRFARTANVVQGPEYLAFATSLNQAGLPGETKAIIDAGIAAGAVQRGEAGQLLALANRRIAEDQAGLPGQIAQARRAANGRDARIVADVLYGYGRYAEAAELYRLALSKGGEDANMINSRLGASLALAGQRAEAEAALRAVTGSRTALASLWLAWLASRPA